MGDTTGSSIAAPSAQLIEQTTPSPEPSEKDSGFFSRVISALSPSQDGGSEATVIQSAPRAQPHGMINLRRMRIEDVAIPKADIICVPVTADKDELLRVFRDSGMTRLPVYDGTLDSPLGFAHLKDFALLHGFNSNGPAFDLQAMLRPLLFVPPSMPIGILLTKMQTERRHMALVIDEYGGVDGLVTIEDLIEQVIGEIEDEHDTEEADLWTLEKSGQYLVQAKAPLDEFEAAIGLHLTEDDEIDAEEIDTLGGLVFMLAGHVPARGEVVRHPAGYEFEVIDADPRRIKRLRVRLAPPPAE
ncbi:hemolysin family protein [Planktotalea arctica]|uniref:hemolysin family protein n=1 Tax=Planktotalea arctica TaxID=1481893 RepID=UPI000A17218D|nr:hemolysin family protein [Planktotalea arctica]